MGLWSATCCISGLTIQWEDIQTGVVMLSKNYDNPGGACYIDDFWNVVSPPMWGEYGGYGNVELDETSVSYRITDGYLKDNVAKYKNVKNTMLKIHDEKVTYIKDGLSGFNNRKSILGYTFVRKDVWDALASNKLYQFPESEVCGKRITKVISMAIKNSCNVGAADCKDFSRLEYSLLSGLGFGNCVPLSLSSAIKNLKDFNFSNTDIKELVQIVLDNSSVTQAMSDLRIPWVPQTGLGSQSNNHKSRAGFYEQMMNIAKSIPDDY